MDTKYEDENMTIIDIANVPWSLDNIPAEFIMFCYKDFMNSIKLKKRKSGEYEI